MMPKTAIKVQPQAIKDAAPAAYAIPKAVTVNIPVKDETNIYSMISHSIWKE